MVATVDVTVVTLSYKLMFVMYKGHVWKQAILT